MRVKYETARGNENPSLREVNQHEKTYVISPDYGYDYILRGEVYDDGMVIWGGRDMTLNTQEFNELQQDLANYIAGL